MGTDDEWDVSGIVVRGKRLLPPVERGRPFPPGIRICCAAGSHCGLEGTGAASLPSLEV